MSDSGHRTTLRSPRRPLRVLGVDGWIRWLFKRRDRRGWTTYTLDFDGELEDFDTV